MRGLDKGGDWTKGFTVILDCFIYIWFVEQDFVVYNKSLKYAGLFSSEVDICLLYEFYRYLGVLVVVEWRIVFLIFWVSDIIGISHFNILSHMVIYFWENWRLGNFMWIWFSIWFLICFQFVNLSSALVKDGVIVIVWMALYEVILCGNSLGSSVFVVMWTSNHWWSLINFWL